MNNGNYRGYRMKVEQEKHSRIKGWKKEEVSVMYFFYSGITQNISFLVPMEERQSDQKIWVEEPECRHVY